MGRFDWLETEVAKTQKPAEEKERFDANHYIQEAERFYREGAYESALKFYSKALGENSELVDAWDGQVRCLIDLDELKEARLWVNKALEKFPESAEIISAKSVILAKMFELNEALVLSNKAIAKKNPSKHIWLDRGFILLCHNDEENAGHCFSKVLDGNPQDAFFNLRIGICYLDGKKFSKAKPYLDKSSEVSPENPLALYKLGQCYQGLDFLSKSEWCYEKALALKPEFKNEIEAALNKIKGTGIFTRLFSWIRRIWQDTI